MTIRDLMHLYVGLPGSTRFVFCDGRNVSRRCTFLSDEVDNISDELLDSIIYRFGVTPSEGYVAESTGYVTPAISFVVSVFDYPKRTHRAPKEAYPVDSIPVVNHVGETFSTDEIKPCIDKKIEPPHTTYIDVPDTASPSVPVITCMI